jgi:hypothetical protein
VITYAFAVRARFERCFACAKTHSLESRIHLWQRFESGVEIHRLFESLHASQERRRGTAFTGVEGVAGADCSMVSTLTWSSLEGMRKRKEEEEEANSRIFKTDEGSCYPGR